MSKHDPKVILPLDYETLWETVQNDLPMLLATVEEMLRDLATERPG